jgi:hypothetical protein
MDAVRLFRFLAFVNIASGAVLAVEVIVSLVGILGSNESHLSLFIGLFLALVGTIAGTLIRLALRHLRQPTQKSAVAIAANTAVIAWFLLSMSLTAAGSDRANEIMEHACVLVSVALGYLCYRFLLKPAALRAFPSAETGAAV